MADYNFDKIFKDYCAREKFSPSDFKKKILNLKAEEAGGKISPASHPPLTKEGDLID